MKKYRMVFVLSTRNPKKVEELAAVLGNLDHELVSLDDFEKEHGVVVPEVEETAETFYGNALLKAEALYQRCLGLNLGWGVIADDSGLVVPLLNGEPGVQSARYAEDKVTKIDVGGGGRSIHRANIDKLHRRLRTQSEYRESTSAYFQTVIVLLVPPSSSVSSKGKDFPEVIVGEGRCEGSVIDEYRGDKGFGYDPIFIPGEDNSKKLTFAEMEPEAKNAVSHRARAIKAVLEKLGLLK